MDFKDYLKQLREAAKITQEIVAEKMGVTVQTIANWEQGRSTPDISNICKIVKIYSGSTKDAEHLLKILAFQCETTIFENNDTTKNDCKFKEFLPEYFDYDKIKDFYFNKEEQEIFNLLALHSIFNSYPVKELLNITNNTVKILTILDKFDKLNICKITDHHYYTTSSYDNKGSVYSNHFTLGNNGETIKQYIMDNPFSLFNIFNTDFKTFLELCCNLDLLDKEKKS